MTERLTADASTSVPPLPDRPPFPLQGHHMLLALALLILNVALIWSVTKGLSDQDLLPSLWPSAVGWVGLIAISMTGISVLMDHVYQVRQTPRRWIGLLVVGCLVGTALGAAMLARYDRYEQTSLSRLRGLPATLPYRAATEHGVYTGRISGHDLSCGTLDTLIAGGYDPLFPAFSVQTVGTAPNDAVVQTGEWSVTSLKTDPAAVQVIKRVPAAERRWLWHRLGCPGISLNGPQGVTLRTDLPGTSG